MSQGKRVTQRSQLHELAMARIQWRMRDHLRRQHGFVCGKEMGTGGGLHADPGHEANVVDARILHDVVDGAAPVSSGYLTNREEEDTD